MATTSLAQVYPALYPDGSHVVVKVRRPNVERIVETDLEVLLDITAGARAAAQHRAVSDPVELAEEFAIALREELDYQHEGATPTSSASTSKMSRSFTCRASIGSTPRGG